MFKHVITRFLTRRQAALSGPALPPGVPRESSAGSEARAASGSGRSRERGRTDHVILIDGTLCSLRAAELSNVGLTFNLLAEGGARPGLTLWYEAGIPWRGWRHIMDLITGTGIDAQILRAYSHLASHYRPGDRIFLFGYSRGAFAVRSLAGVIDRTGLLRHDKALERNIRLAWRYYRDGDSAAARSFRRRYCHAETPLRMIGIWETVKALGLRLPLLWLFATSRYAFHDDKPGRQLEFGFQALALDETRHAYSPLVWQSRPQSQARLEQVWFRGSHADIGGQIGSQSQARPLSNIPLVWMLDRAETAGLSLPPGWRNRFPCDPKAPMTGTRSGYGALFLWRARRIIGQDASERLHESVPQSARIRWQAARRGAPTPTPAQPMRDEIQAAAATSPISKG